MENFDRDVVIVGAGPAGLSAAQMLGRAGRRTLVLDAASPRNRFASHTHAVVGFDGVPPEELHRRGRVEAAAYGVTFRAGTLTGVDDIPGGVALTLADGTRLTARALVVATGATDRLPDIPGLAAAWGRSVLHCPYCHGWEVRDGRLGVLATSALSLHQVELIRQWSPHVVAFTAGLGEIGAEVRERLLARGIRLVASPVAVVEETGGQIAGVRTIDGGRYDLDALFTGGAIDPLDGFLAGLALARTETPVGSFIAVDERGATSHPRVWAAGNVVNPMANVPVSMGAGSMAGAGANAGLVADDISVAVTRRRAHVAEWEARYAESDRVWSGRVNATTAALIDELVADGLQPGTALDLGSGEGGDAVWLAERGWRVTGVDLSPTAVARATAAANERGVDASFVAGDIDDLDGGDAGLGLFDLVTASFLHSWDAGFSRIRLLRAAAARIAPGGHLVSVSHAAPPPWAQHRHDLPEFASPAEERRELGLDPAEWSVVAEEVRSRSVTGPDGAPATLDDGVLVLRRRR